MIVFRISLTILAFIFMPIACTKLLNIFYTLKTKRYLLKNANKAIEEATIWKDDIEYFLHVIEVHGPITLCFEGSDIIYDYNKMNSLLNKTTHYIQNYIIYIQYIKSGQYFDLTPPNFCQAQILPNPNSLEQHVTRSSVEKLNQERNIRFFNYLHEYRIVLILNAL